jgi:crotonobetainyl-CoA:carnitine CoA-transferase CaiB-like acyl-CoA transferase
MLSLRQGLRIVDLSTIVLGPYATQFLGDFGADVIKVEAINGDVFRAVRPGP